MAATTVSIINLKGGVGKSTLTMVLGEFLAFRFSKNVLLIDMDAQANLSHCMVPDFQIEQQFREGRTAYHLLRAGFEDQPLDVGDYITQPPLVVSNILRSAMLTPDTDVHMVVSTPAVSQLDEDLMDLWGEGGPMPAHLRRTLQRAVVPALDHYDYILIDCPPGLSVFSSAALMASDYYVSPIIPEPLSLQGVDLVQDRQAQLVQRYGAKAEFAEVILNVVKHYRNTHSRVSDEIFGERTRYRPFEYWLSDSERLRSIGEYDPDKKGKWASGMDRKFSSLHQKYSLSYRLANPKLGSLNRGDAEGAEYRLEERIAALTGEFMSRCPPRG